MMERFGDWFLHILVEVHARKMDDSGYVYCLPANAFLSFRWNVINMFFFLKFNRRVFSADSCIECMYILPRNLVMLYYRDAAILRSYFSQKLLQLLGETSTIYPTPNVQVRHGIYQNSLLNSAAEQWAFSLWRANSCLACLHPWLYAHLLLRNFSAYPLWKRRKYCCFWRTGNVNMAIFHIVWWFYPKNLRKLHFALPPCGPQLWKSQK